MSRATSAVEMEVDRGLPRLEHALACLDQAFANFFSSFDRYGNGRESITLVTGA